MRDLKEIKTLLSKTIHLENSFGKNVKSGYWENTNSGCEKFFNEKGEMIGNWFDFTPGGNLHEMGEMKDGLPNGIWIQFFPEKSFHGKTIPELRVRYIKTYKDNELNGWVLRFDENGNITQKFYVENDKYEGMYEIISHGIYRNPYMKVIEYTRHFYENGNCLRTESFTTEWKNKSFIKNPENIYSEIPLVYKNFIIK